VAETYTSVDDLDVRTYTRVGDHLLISGAVGWLITRLLLVDGRLISSTQKLPCVVGDVRVGDVRQSVVDGRH
jgi:hypothetical protein